MVQQTREKDRLIATRSGCSCSFLICQQMAVPALQQHSSATIQKTLKLCLIHKRMQEKNGHKANKNQPYSISHYIHFEFLIHLHREIILKACILCGCTYMCSQGSKKKKKNLNLELSFFFKIQKRFPSSSINRKQSVPAPVSPTGGGLLVQSA